MSNYTTQQIKRDYCCLLRKKEKKTKIYLKILNFSKKKEYENTYITMSLTRLINLRISFISKF